MANLLWRSGSSNIDSSFTLSSLNLGAPAGVQVGELLFGMFGCATFAPSAAPTINLPADWTQIRTDTQTINAGALNARKTFAYKIATGGDSYTFTLSSGAALFGLVGCWENPNTSSPYQTDTRAAFTGTDTAVATGLTTEEANELLIYVGFIDQNSSTTWSPPVDMAERMDVHSSIFADVIQASAGASGDKTGVASALSIGTAHLFAFRSEISISAALTGTAAASITENDIVAGGKTIILTLNGDTWIAS